jgi:hypothetical protein
VVGLLIHLQYQCTSRCVEVSLELIPDVLTTLAQQRLLFHSEADFQHAFAWEIHKRLPQALVRLERPVLHENKLLYVDIWVVHNDALE